MAQNTAQAWPELIRNTLLHFLAAGSVLLMTLLWFEHHHWIHWGAVVRASALFGIIVLGVTLTLRGHLPQRWFGLGNRITLLRALMLCLLAALEDAFSRQAWLLSMGGILFLLLDGADGYAARRTRSASPFGARFDVEVDSLYVLVITLLVWDLDKAGLWVMGSGLLRYVYISLGYWLPSLRTPLPPSLRRSLIGIINSVLLTLCLLPPIQAPLAALMALLGLVLTLVSFVRDVYLICLRPHAFANPHILPPHL